MAATQSSMVPLGTKAPPFKLKDTISGEFKTLEELQGDVATVVMFICNHCPFVKHIQEELVRIANNYIPKGISFIAISSNDVESHPEDGPEQMRERSRAMGYPFSYLFDETQETAKAYEAECTPDFFVFDKNLKLAYRGQLDDSRPGNNERVNGKDLREALDCLLNGKAVPGEQKPSVGCNIKWK